MIVSVSSRVHAQAAEDCQSLIAALRADTEAVQLVGKNASKDLSGLLAKLDESIVKLDEGKFCDSIAKLADFKARVQQLSGAGKLPADAADQLSGDADAAIACVGDAATSANVSCAL
jgi:hypothetical protein